MTNDDIIWVPVLIGQTNKQPELAINKTTNKSVAIIEVTQDMQFRVKFTKTDGTFDPVLELFQTKDLAKQYIINKL